MPSTSTRSLRCILELAKHTFVGVERSGSTMPCAAVGLFVSESVGDCAVRCLSLGPRCSLIEGRAHKRMTKLEQRAAYGDET